ncbi:methyltransferase, FxLD system [Streptomyces sp. NPDC049881]|uniref:methyltransferase, FxLD system n=1 Tax=Streptomyces sp. NPDC049881 TaxID=3155778 RepID=UPI003415D989
MTTVRYPGVGDAASPSHSERNAALIEDLRASGWLRTDRVADALEAVPRGHFVPPELSGQAYANEVVFTKRDVDGTALSSVSAPWLVAGMLERLAPREGERVLEIGSGGWNAALLRHLVGADGRVTTVDIDSDVVDRAVRTLAGTPWQDVRVVQGDGRAGFRDDAPYDGIMVTVQASRIEPAWLDQLASGGRLVVPLRLRGMGRLLTFTAENGHWRGGGWEQCGFVRMRGEGAAQDTGATYQVADGIRLRVHDSALPEASALTGAAQHGRRELWSGVTVGITERTRPLVDLWLATVWDRYGRLLGDPPSGGDGVAPLPGGSSATWTSTTLAYVTMRAADDSGTRFEYGVAWHGPDAGLAEQVTDQLRAWDQRQRGGQGPSLMLYRDQAPSPSTTARVLGHGTPRLVLTWPR